MIKMTCGTLLIAEIGDVITSIKYAMHRFAVHFREKSIVWIETAKLCYDLQIVLSFDGSCSSPENFQFSRRDRHQILMHIVSSIYRFYYTSTIRENQ